MHLENYSTMNAKYLILDKDLHESFNESHAEISYTLSKFSGGEPHITLDLTTLPYNTHVCIVTRLKKSHDIITLAAAVSALNHSGAVKEMSLLIGYIPGSRQDRLCNLGEALTSKVYADIINGMYNWQSIQVIDSHSDVSPALLDNCINVSNLYFTLKALKEIDVSSGVIVSPDAGANKKVHSVLMQLNSHYPDKFEMVRADKKRDLSTGQILETIVYADDLAGKECIIIDDICDGGRTFIELAKVLKDKGASSVILLVTHGIFSKGYDVVLEHIDQIVTTNSFANLSDDDGDRISVIGINNEFYNWAEHA